MTCEMCVNYGFYEMVTSGKPFGYSGTIPCFTCERYCNLNDKFVLKEERGNKDMRKEIVKYEVAGDGIGLLGYFANGTFYHIHSDELSTLERWILSLLKSQALKKQ